MPPHDKPAVADEGACRVHAAGRTVIETEQPLSRSLLWDLQRRYFEAAGVAAWSTGTVPHYVTSNPALAYAYAQVFLGFLRDLAAAKEASGEPVTIVELGSGSGKFGFLFLKALTDLRRRSALAAVPVRFVMTDFAEANVRFWQEHEALRPFVEEGLLDFAVFDAEAGREIRLLRAGETLGPGSLRSPLGVIANYVFDGVRQDAFSFDGGRIEECLVSLACPEEVSPDRSNPDLLGRIEVAYTRRPTSLDHYGEPDLDAILRGYAGRLDGATVLFPREAIRCVQRLADLAGGRLFMLSGDRGQVHERALAAPEDPAMATHGSFSLDVNYHAIAEWVRARRGVALSTAHRHVALNVVGCLLGDHPSGYAETRLAYEEVIERAGPDDAYALRRGLQGGYDSMALSAVLSAIRLSRWDPRVLKDCLPALWKHQGRASTPACAEVIATVMRAWENHYPMGEEHDLAFEIALLVHAYGGHRQAISLFRASVRTHGDGAKARWNMGVCHFALGELEAAFACFGEAARLEPGFVPAGGMQIKG